MADGANDKGEWEARIRAQLDELERRTNEAVRKAAEAHDFARSADEARVKAEDVAKTERSLRVAAEQREAAQATRMSEVQSTLQVASRGLNTETQPATATPAVAAANVERERILFDVWSKAVDTQMHFNEMATRSRQLGLTFVVSALGLGVFLLGKGDDWQLSFSLSEPKLRLHSASWVSIVLLFFLLMMWLLNPTTFRRAMGWAPDSGERGVKASNATGSGTRWQKATAKLRGGWHKTRWVRRQLHRFGLPVLLLSIPFLWWWGISDRTWPVGLKTSGIAIHVSVVLVAASIVALLLIRVLDLGVYHKMLRGAVAFGEDLEQQYLKPLLMPGLQKGMTEAISSVSRRDADFTSKEKEKDERAKGKEGVVYGYKPRKETTAFDKVRLFYYRTGAFLVFVVVALFVYSNYQSASVKHNIAKTHVRELVLEGHASWSAANAGKTCPSRLDDVSEYLRNKDATDPWGGRYKMLCGASLPKGVKSGIAVYSAGPDGIENTSDDVKSWE